MKTISNLEIYKLALYPLISMLESERRLMNQGSVIAIKRFEKLNDQVLELNLEIIKLEGEL